MDKTKVLSQDEIEKILDAIEPGMTEPENIISSSDTCESTITESSLKRPLSKLEAVKQFAETPTELDETLENFSKGMMELSTLIAMLSEDANDAFLKTEIDASLLSSISSIMATSSQETLNKIMGCVHLLKREIGNAKAYVSNRIKMKYSLYSSSRIRVDRSSFTVQSEINLGTKDMHESEAHKRAYYEALKVAHDFRSLVYEYNEVIAEYNNMWNTNLTHANINFKFFKMNADLNGQKFERAWSVSFTPIPEGRLHLKYPDGEERVFDVWDYIRRHNWSKGVWRNLFDQNYFNTVKSNFGMPDWEDGLITIDPEVMLAESKSLNSKGMS